MDVDHSHEKRHEHWHSHEYGHHHSHEHSAEHGHVHGHEAGHGHADLGAERELKFAIAITALILVAELVGGVVSNSLALLSDAGHVLSDFLALGLSYLALRLAARPASLSRTFGLHRMEIFAALINGVVLLAISLWIFMEAYNRFQTPEFVKTTEMMIIAVIGLMANLWVVYKLHGFTTNLNVKSAYFHALGDAASSTGVVIGGIIIILTGEFIVDAVIGGFIGVMIATGAIRLLRESTHILMEGTPKHLHVDDVKNAIISVPGVHDVSDLHVWSICSDIHAASAHIVVGDVKLSDIESIHKKIEQALERFHIEHTTFQFITGK
jgi:cobalt-zinc-cadmium efflux system protein